MKDQTTRWLFYFTAFGVFLLMGRLVYLTGFDGLLIPSRQKVAGSPFYILFFIWNLFLAWIPYLLSTQLKNQGANNWRAWTLTFFWLLFLPNAPYLITDLMHLRQRPPIPIWYDAILFFLFVATGLILGLLSMRNLHRYWQKCLPQKMIRPLIIAVWALCSFGLYLGRVGRWNSWDLFTNPFSLFHYTLGLFGSVEQLLSLSSFVLVFTLFLCLGYFFMEQSKMPSLNHIQTK